MTGRKDAHFDKGCRVDTTDMILAIDELMAAPSTEAYQRVKASIIQAMRQVRAEEQDRSAFFCEALAELWPHDNGKLACLQCARVIREAGANRVANKLSD